MRVVLEVGVHYRALVNKLNDSLVIKIRNTEEAV